MEFKIEDIKDSAVKYLLKNPEAMLLKKPFVRGIESEMTSTTGDSVDCNKKATASLPNFQYTIVDQSQYLRELDPQSHSVLYDENIPSITAKTKDGNYVAIENKKMPVSFQKNIRNKQVLHLCANPMDFSLMDIDPSEQQEKDFITFKQYWSLRNQDGMKTKMVNAQKSVGDAGLLYYFDSKNRIKSRLISYPEYVIIPHNDKNGDRVMETLYYRNESGECIDSYDDKYMYSYRLTEKVNESKKEWILTSAVEHGFDEIPLISKRGQVAWENVQEVIDVYERLYNVFVVIQKRHGWGILWIDGKLSESSKRIAGNVVLESNNIGGQKSDAKFLSAPNPQGTIDTLQLMEDTIQKGSGTTFILPKDIKISGNISGIAIQLTQSMDIETALQGVSDWQNVADKMIRLFKQGLAKELVSSKIQNNAITSFNSLNINGKFKVWRPQSDVEFSQMLVTLKGSGLISEETGIELAPVARPDEKARRKREKDAEKESLLLNQGVVSPSPIDELIVNQNTVS